MGWVAICWICRDSGWCMIWWLMRTGFQQNDDKEGFSFPHQMQESQNSPLYWFRFQIELNKKKIIKNLICKLDPQSTFRENIKRSIWFTGRRNLKKLRDSYNPIIERISRISKKYWLTHHRQDCAPNHQALGFLSTSALATTSCPASEEEGNISHIAMIHCNI